jgi:3-methylcrotonyl-CoA carboxylase alpha subunit
VLAAAAHALLQQPESGPGPDPWTALTGFRCNAEPDRSVLVEVDGVQHRVETLPEDRRGRVVAVGGERVLFLDGMGWRFGAARAEHTAGIESSLDGVILSPMPGHVIALDVAEGEPVTKGQTLLVVEAMKMENRLLAPFDGVVAELRAATGQQVAEGVMLARIERRQD